MGASPGTIHGVSSSNKQQQDLRELADSSSELAEGLRTLARGVDRSGPKPARVGGRRSRASTDSELVALAPFPELVTLNTGRLYQHIRMLQEVETLRLAHSFECQYLRRTSVAGWIEKQLRELGEPLGGPSPPFADYALLSVEQIKSRLDGASPALAAHVYAFEHYHRRRRGLLRAAQKLAGAAGDLLVVATAPPRWGTDAPEPFSGYLALRTQPDARVELRAALAACSEQELVVAVSFEQAGKRRRMMLEALSSELRSRGSRPSRTSASG